jgi:chemotaxis protein MotB
LSDPLVQRRPKKLRAKNHDRWLVSYADLVTLLFAVFVVMYAISNVDAEKLERLVSTMQVAFDTGGGVGPPLLEPVGALESFLSGGEPVLVGVRHRLLERLARHIAQDRVDVTLDERGLVISIREEASFALGSADLSASAESIIGEVAAMLADNQNPVMVEGHTDNVPIRTARFASNWELSTGRATAVVAFLIEKMGVSPSRLSAAGYGEFRPQGPNDTADNRGRNRRVDIVVQRAIEMDGVEPGSSSEALW